MASTRYGASSVRRSLQHFLLGKGLGALLGLIWLFSLVRVLPGRDYGAYLSLYAYLELMLLISGWGLVQVLERFVPELHARHEDHAVTGLCWRLLLLRAGLLLACIGLAWQGRLPLLGVLGLQGFDEAFALANGLLFLEAMMRSVDSVHEALLLQGRAQQSVLLRNAARSLPLLACALLQVSLDLHQWLRLEMALLTACLLGTAILFVRSMGALRSDAAPADPAPTPWRRLARYALPLFAAQLLWLLSSTDALKLVVNRQFGLQAAALFGFCLALSQVVQRYLPSNLLAGLVRPLFVVAAQRPDAPQRLQSLARLVIKLNLLPLLPFLGFALIHEDALLAWASGARFALGEQLMPLLILLVLLQALKSCLLLLSTAREDSMAALWSSFGASSAFVVLLWALQGSTLRWTIAALLGAELLSLALLQWRTALQGLLPRWPAGALLRLLLCCLLVQGVAAVLAGLHPLSAGREIALGAVAGLLAAALALKLGFFEQQETGWLLELMPGPLRKRFDRKP